MDMSTKSTMSTIKKLDRYIDALNNEKKPGEHEGRPCNEDFYRLTETVRRVKALRDVSYPEKEFEKSLIENVSASVARSGKTKGADAGGRVGRHRQTAARALKRTIAVTAAVAAAVLVIFSAATIISNKESHSIAYAMEKAIEALKAYHGIIEYAEINGQGETIIQSRKEVWADRQGNYYVKELEGVGQGSITVNNGQKKWQLRQQEQAVYIFESFPDPYRFSFELGSELEELKGAISVKEIGEEQISGRDVVVLEITPDAGSPYKLWVDKESKLPLQRESAMHNALMYRVSYSFIEYVDEIPAELLSYELPDGYAEINSNPELLVAGLKEAEEITGIQAVMPEGIPAGYVLDKIAVIKSSPAVKLYYNKEEKHLIISQTPAEGELRPGTGSIIGRVGDGRAEIIDDGQLRSVRWQQDDMEFTVLGNDDMEAIRAFVLSLADGELIIPEREAGSGQEEKRPQIELELDIEALENEQKSVDAGHSPWRLDPVYVAQVFASLLLSPEGISGDYPIAYEDIELVENNGVEAVAIIHDEKSIARVVYLKRPVRQDETGIWAVVGYDTDENR